MCVCVQQLGGLTEHQATVSVCVCVCPTSLELIPGVAVQFTTSKDKNPPLSCVVVVVEPGGGVC